MTNATAPFFLKYTVCKYPPCTKGEPLHKPFTDPGVFPAPWYYPQSLRRLLLKVLLSFHIHR